MQRTEEHSRKISEALKGRHVSVRSEYAIKPFEERFWSKVDIQDSDSNGCWEWRASRKQDGYGEFAVTTGNIEVAHRVAWILTNGLIPEGLFVCHSCDNPPCCNPNHLFLGTAKQNRQDRMQKGDKLVERVWRDIHLEDME